MKIHRSHPAGRFTIIPDETLRDPRLSYMARGVLCEILSRPDDWQTSADAIATRAQAERERPGEGRRGIRSVFAELSEAGYLVRVRIRGPRGRVITELHVYDRHEGASRDTSAQNPGGTSVPPAEMEMSPARTDDHPSGTSVPPAETPILPVRTDVPLTDVPPGRYVSTETEYGDRKEEGRSGETESATESPTKGHPSQTRTDREFPMDRETVADDAQQIPSPPVQSPATDRNARAGEANGLATGSYADLAQQAGKPGADAPCPDPPPAGPDAKRRPGHWRSPQQKAAEQAAESRAMREAAERAAAVTQ